MINDTVFVVNAFDHRIIMLLMNETVCLDGEVRTQPGAECLNRTIENCGVTNVVDQIKHVVCERLIHMLNIITFIIHVNFYEHLQFSLAEPSNPSSTILEI